MSRDSLSHDRTEIIELANRFEIAFDDGDFDAHMATWTEELSFTSPFGNYDTRESYLEWVQGFYEMTQQAGGTRHLISNAVVEVEGDEATLVAYLSILNRSEGRIMGTARFDDRLVRTPDGWRFGARALQPDDNVAID